jgi:hypothetical protein
VERELEQWQHEQQQQVYEQQPGSVCQVTGMSFFAQITFVVPTEVEES